MMRVYRSFSLEVYFMNLHAFYFDLVSFLACEKSSILYSVVTLPEYVIRINLYYFKIIVLYYYFAVAESKHTVYVLDSIKTGLPVIYKNLFVVDIEKKSFNLLIFWKWFSAFVSLESLWVCSKNSIFLCEY